MYTTLRRTTVVFVMLLEWLQSNKTSSSGVQASVVLMIVGALVAGYRDLHFDLLSYSIVFLYNLCTALYLVLINDISVREKRQAAQVEHHEHLQHRPPLDKYDFMFYNNVITIPLLALIVLATDETRALVHSPHASNPYFLLSLLASSLLAFLLNYAIFANTAKNSALTQTVSGQAKDVIVVALGYLAFDDSHMDVGNAVGVALGFAGSVAYAVARMRHAQHAAADAAAKGSRLKDGVGEESGELPNSDEEAMELGHERKRLHALLPLNGHHSGSMHDRHPASQQHS